ncbi:MAG: hypothetical protein ACRD43_13480 [Pyrinomonadaceae bacterium]
MKLTKGLLSLTLVFLVGLITFLSLPVHTVIAQDGKAALQRGYRTGYSDGYMSGYRDTLDRAAKNPSGHDDYKDAIRAYNQDYGSIGDYKDGYQQGYESGYDSGFEKRSFDSALPEKLDRRGVRAQETPAIASSESERIQSADTSTAQPPAGTSDSTIQTASYDPSSDATIIILKDTDLVLQLQDDLSTGKNRVGDKFTAKVVSPAEISGALIEGRVDKVTKPGRLKRRSELSLSFDRIVLNEKRWANFNAMLTEVMPIKGDNVSRVDNEGTAVGKSSMKPDIIKVGAATGTGAAIGALTGGPVGAAVGAGVGAAFGVGAVVIERGKHIELNKNQQIRVKTGYEIQIK